MQFGTQRSIATVIRSDPTLILHIEYTPYDVKTNYAGGFLASHIFNLPKIYSSLHWLTLPNRLCA